jgi:hypothetical protein
MNTDGAELFHIGVDKKGYRTYDTVYIKDSNSVAACLSFLLTMIISHGLDSTTISPNF